MAEFRPMFLGKLAKEDILYTGKMAALGQHRGAVVFSFVLNFMVDSSLRQLLPSAPSQISQYKVVVWQRTPEKTW